VLEAVIKVLSTRTHNINIVESDGGSHAWTAETAFKGHRIPEICDRYGARAVNLTNYTREYAETEVSGRSVRLEMSRLLTRETDLLITMPVPKMHVMTRVSLGFKNQWGCLPDVKRLRHHPEFALKVLAINKMLKPGLVIFDGTYFLNRSGPMDGDAVRMNLLIASNDIGAGTLACCELMGIDPFSVAHLRRAITERMMPRTLDDIMLNASIDHFKGPRFFLERSFSQWIGAWLFHSKVATYALYDSPLAKPAHEALYLLRGRPKDNISPRW
jgi:uncharacterized protein (DUF362 family)